MDDFGFILFLSFWKLLKDSEEETEDSTLHRRRLNPDLAAPRHSSRLAA
jgi:hypothetical protein